ncbi:transcription antitermination factor NusB [Mariprofundus ferrinatatus]|nr:transcription antitermination factor NusB [Mariprofundus ferrinatatus]
MSVRQAAIEILNRVFSDRIKAGEALESIGATFQDRDRRLLHEMVYGVLRRFYSLEADFSRFSRVKPDPVSHIALLTGTYQLRHMRIPTHAAVSETVSAVKCLQPKAANFVNAVLRRVAESEAPKKLKPHQRMELPKWIYTEWRDAFGAEAVSEFGQALKEPPKLSLALFVDRESWIETVTGMGIAAVAGELSPYAVLLPSGTDVARLPGFEEGAFTVMDQAAQASVMALELSKPDGLILDICAAPGGKASLLAHRFSSAKILAIELNPRRIPRLRENLDRLNCSNVTVIQADAGTLPLRNQSADAIMLDAPCSASGVLRRHPDAKFMHDSEAVERLADVQKTLISESLRVLNPDGEMIYAVCSVHPRENEKVIEGVSELRAAERLLPSESHDGFFFARIGGSASIQSISECESHE